MGIVARAKSGAQVTMEDLLFFRDFCKSFSLCAMKGIWGEFSFWFRCILPKLFKDAYVATFGKLPITVPLPEGALLDYRHEMDEMHAKVKVEADRCMENSAKVLNTLQGMAKETHRIVAEQKKVFSYAGMRIGEPNPIAELTRDTITIIDDIAEFSRKHEIKMCEEAGFVPKEGWELALARLDGDSKKGGTMGEISNVLLHRDDTDFEDILEDASAADSSGCAGKKNDAAALKSSGKAVVRRVKI
ncbi:MAG: hypothetical protein LBT64_00170 [Puniceicoccales bacterium]|jgi:hypothetical protein|nr:hypothetical protein [Puniceicoccales bacterium]